MFENTRVKEFPLIKGVKNDKTRFKAGYSLAIKR